MLATCCTWLANMLQTAGQQGFGVVAFRDDDYRRFYLVARMFEPAQERALAVRARAAPGDERLAALWRNERGGPEGIATAMRIPLRYCPSCGRDLNQYVARHREAFDEIAEQHRRYAIVS